MCAMVACVLLFATYCTIASVCALPRTLVIFRKNGIKNRTMSNSSSPWDVDIDALVADRQAFSEFVYMPLE